MKTLSEEVLLCKYLNINWKPFLWLSKPLRKMHSYKWMHFILSESIVFQWNHTSLMGEPYKLDNAF